MNKYWVHIKHNVIKMLMLFAVIASTAGKGFAQTDGYTYFKDITIQSSEVSGTLSDFPVLVSVTDNDLLNKAGTDGFDIIFATSDGNTILDHELESYDSGSGTLVAWVKVPSVTDASNTTIRMYYGNSSITSDQSVNTVWGTDYQLVMHMDGTSNSSTVSQTITDNGTAAISGQIGDARQFLRNETDYITVADNAGLDITGDITISFWYYATNNAPDVIIKGTTSPTFEAEIAQGRRPNFRKNGSDFMNSDNSPQLNNTQWYYLVYRQSSSGMEILEGASVINSDTDASSFNTNNEPLYISNTADAINGYLDEVRISNIAKSDDWITTEYNNQSNPGSFMTFGSEGFNDDTPPDAPQNVSGNFTSPTSIRITFDDVDESGSGVASYSIKRSTTQGSGYAEVGTVTDDENANYEFIDNSVSTNTTYYYVVTAVDANGNESANSSEIELVPDTVAPNAPTNIIATALENAVVQITFDDVDESGSGVATYSIKRSTTQGSGYVEVGTVTDDESVNYTFTDSGTADGITYYYIVNAIDAISNGSPNSSEVFATADGTGPILQTAEINGNALVLTYNETLGVSTPASSDYSIEVNSTSTSINSIFVSGTQVNITVNPEVEVGDVVAISYTAGSNPIEDAAGNAAADFNDQAVTNNTQPTLPTPPIELSATAVAGGDIEITFDDVDVLAGVASYTIKRNSTPGGAYTQIGTVTDDESVNYTFTDNTSVNGITYYYVITSTDLNGLESIDSEEISATADDVPPTLQFSSTDGTTLVIDYDELLNESSVPNALDFTVRVNGGSRTINSVDVSGPRVIITLDPAVVAGDNIELDYAVGSNPIEDVAGNDASPFSNQNSENVTFNAAIFGPDPCPIVNGQDVAWSCFSGAFDGTTMTANVGGQDIATVTAATGSNTTFAPNALQQWASGSFSGDQFNGPQANPVGSSGDATSLDITISSEVPSDGIILSLNRLRPNAGATSYTLEAFDAFDNPITLNDWQTGQGTDGGVCTNSVNLVYSNGNTTIEFQPTVSGDASCSSSSTPVWFRITDDDVERIELRKVATDADNIHLGLGLIADFGDAPSTFGTEYSGAGTPPAFHLLNNDGVNTVYFGSTVDGDGNGLDGASANGDDTESTGIGSGDDEGAITLLTEINTSETTYSTTLVCTDGGSVGGWIDFDQSGTFDADEYASGICASGSVELTWTGITGLVSGTSYARFRIATDASEVANPIGFAKDGEVEDYTISIIPPPLPDLEITKDVNNSSPVEGDNVTFTITVTNPGEFEATGIRVTDQLPTGLNYTSSTPSQGTYNSTTGVWNIGTLAEGDTTTVTLTISATVASSTLGQTIVNTASITDLDQTDPELNNNSASAGITVVPESADIDIQMVASNPNPIEGEFINYTVSVSNNGPKNSTNLEILTQIPTGIVYIDSVASAGSYNPATGIWDIGTLAVSNNASLTLNVRIDDGTEGQTIDNSAALNDMDQTDPDEANNTGTAPVTVVIPSANLSCGLPYLRFRDPVLIGGSALNVGAMYRFNNVLTGVYADVEIITINNVTIADIDDGDTYGLPDEFSPFFENVTGDEGYVDFEISFYDSASGLAKYLSFAATTADVDGTGSLQDFVGYQSLSSFIVESTTDLIPGSEGIYTTFVSSNFDDTTPTAANFTDYKVYASYTNEKSFRLRTGMKSGGTIDDRIVSVNFDPCEINTFDDPVSQLVVDVSVNKTVDQNVVETGDQVIYTVQATNEKANAVTDVQVTDQIPAGLTYQSHTASQGTYDDVSGEWEVGTLSGLQVATLEITATVDNGTEGNTITNTAILTNTGSPTSLEVDGVAANDVASVDIIVFDPASGTSCTEPPLFSFVNYTLEAGVINQVNSVYRFTGLASGLDALVTVKAINNATLDDVDDNDIANAAANFSPFFTALTGGGYIDWEIQLVQAGTNTPVKMDFALTGLDIDGFDDGGGDTIQDYLGFAQNQSSIVQSGNNILETSAGDFSIFQSSTTTDGNGTFDINHMAYIVYKYTSIFQIRTGSVTGGTYSDDRLVDIDFTQCRNDDFTNPVVTTRDADISIVKTVDQANPLENETVNFTLTVTNSGPEDATEIDVNESIPDGLTLVQAVPSQGTYNELTDIWAIGTLNNGTSATLTLETTVNSGITADSLVNKVWVQGLNQFDPTVANDTSSVTLKISVQLTGTVFEDITGDGVSEDLTFGDASGDQQALENVEVHLFKDGGDGEADGVDDTYEQTVLTDNLGEFVIQVGEDADYWIVVDSKTGELSDGNYWAEQTYAPAGALCESGSGTTTETTVAGDCFGGRRGDQSDNISTTPVATDLPNAEHVAKVTVSGTGQSDINFGFSFNVVTNIDDDDEDGSVSRSAQGTLRQFITNANAITGANTMRFVPAVTTNSSSWWTASISGTLPEITDPLTTIDGTAFDMSSPKTELNINSGSVGTGSAVGIDNLSVSTVDRPEFEIDLNDAGTGAFVINSTGAITIRDVAVYNNTTTLEVKGTSNGLIENALIGTRADGSDPSGAARSEKGIEFSGSSSLTTLIQQTYLAFLDGSGIYSENSSANITVFDSEIYRAAQSVASADGIEGTGTWTVEQNRIHENGNGSSSTVNGGSGIELGGTTSTSGNTIRNNSIYSNATTGILTLNGVTNSIIEKNLIYQNGTNYTSGTKFGAGVRLATPDGVSQDGIRITRNSFYSNYGISIDVVTIGTGEADGVSPNDGATQASSSQPNTGLDYPIFTLSTLEGTALTVEGFVGTNASPLQETYTIEIYKAEDDGDSDALIEVGGTLTSPHGEGRYLLGIITTSTDGSFSTSIDVSGAASTIAFNDRITAIAISSSNNTSEFSANQRVVPTGVSITGFVYHDENHNMSKDPTELGIQGVTIVLYNTQENNCTSVLSNADGSYEFTNVLNGDYDLIESFGQSVPTPDICTPAETDPTDFISTTPNLRSVTVNNLPAFQDFGDFEGIKIEGIVFNDNGITSGTANDGVQNGGEEGIAGQLVKALTSADVLIEQVSAAADGSYELFVPKSVVATGGIVKVEETNGSAYLSTGGDSGTTSGTYDIATDITEFTIATGTVYSGVNFADVQISSLSTDGNLVTQPGAVSIFTHLFDAQTAGDVLFTYESVNNPDINFPVVINHDLDCSGTVDSGEPILTETSAISVVAGDGVCLVVRVTAPSGTNDGATSSTTITATFDYANSSIEQILTRTDLITVSTQDGGLVIIKGVDKAQALPGDTLIYTIDYENLGDEPITEVIVTDEVPIYTTFFSAECGTLTSGVTDCVIEDPGVGERGTVRWTFTGVLQPGDSGTVSYKVLIDN